MKKLVILALAMAGLLSCQCKQQSSTDAVVKNIQTRVSVRKFTNQAPSPEQIETLLRCAMSAPTAMNKQPWLFCVVYEPELLRQIGEQQPNTHIDENVQVCFVMCGDLRKTLEGRAQEFWIHDVSAATENLLLAAHSMGLGAVWCAVQPSEEKIEQIREILSMPKYLVPLCVVPVGYPAEQPEVKDKWKTENIHYNAW